MPQTKMKTCETNIVESAKSCKHDQETADFMSGNTSAAVVGTIMI